MASRKQHPAELRERAVAMVLELRAASGSSRGTLASVGRKLGINPETLCTAPGTANIRICRKVRVFKLLPALTSLGAV
jgi:hypothetical protein